MPDIQPVDLLALLERMNISNADEHRKALAHFVRPADLVSQTSDEFFASFYVHALLEALLNREPVAAIEARRALAIEKVTSWLVSQKSGIGRFSE